MRKSSENDPTRLWRMLAAAQEIQGFLRGETRQTFADSRILQLTVEKLVQNIGEAANQLTATSRGKTITFLG